jgi:hypothetical protein
VLIHLRPRDGFTQATRPAVNRRNELLHAEAEFLELGRIKNCFDRLQPREGIVAAVIVDYYRRRLSNRRTT